MTRILIVDDDEHIRQLVSHVLSTAGFDVLTAADGEEALDLLDEVSVSLAVLDIMMPRMDGWELCRRIRALWDFPLIMLSAKGQTVDKVRGLEMGSDDYLVKPFDAPELLARVRALLRRSGVDASQRRQLGDLVLEGSRYEAFEGGLVRDIPRKEFELLFKLAGSPGRTFTREQILEDIWGYDFDGTERTVDVHINRLRDRFPRDKYPFRLQTVRGLGYRLVVEP